MKVEDNERYCVTIAEIILQILSFTDSDNLLIVFDNTHIAD